MGADFVSNVYPEKLLFSSDRDGSLDIYEADIPMHPTNPILMDES